MGWKDDSKLPLDGIDLNAVTAAFPDAVNTILSLMRHGESEAIRLQAAIAIVECSVNLHQQAVDFSQDSCEGGRDIDEDEDEDEFTD